MVVPSRSLAEQRKLNKELTSLEKKIVKLSDTDINQAIQQAEKLLDLATKTRSNEMIYIALFHLASFYSFKHNELKVIEYTETALRRARKDNNMSASADAYKLRATYYYNHNDYPKALHNILTSLRKIPRLYPTKKRIHSLMFAGITYIRLEKCDLAFEYLEKSLRLARRNKDVDILSTVLYWYGYSLTLNHQYDRSLNMLLRAADANSKLQKDYLVGLSHNSIGLIYWETGRFDKALKHFEKALRYAEKLKNDNLIADVFNNIGLIYKENKEYDKTIEYYKLSLKAREDSGNREKKAITLQNIGNIYMVKEDYVNAEKYFQHALEIRRVLDYPQYTLSVVTAFVRLKTITGDLKGAVKWVDEAEKLIRVVSNKRLLSQAYADLFKYYETTGDYKKALEYHILLTETEQKLKELKMQENMLKLELEYKDQKAKARSKSRLRMEKIKSVLAMAVTASHEINQPLMIIQGNLELFVEKHQDVFETEEDYLYVENIKQAIYRIKATLDSFRTVRNITFESYLEQTPMVVFPQEKPNKKQEI